MSRNLDVRRSHLLTLLQEHNALGRALSVTQLQSMLLGYHSIVVSRNTVISDLAALTATHCVIGVRIRNHVPVWFLRGTPAAQRMQPLLTGESAITGATP